MVRSKKQATPEVERLVSKFFKEGKYHIYALRVSIEERKKKLFEAKKKIIQRSE